MAQLACDLSVQGHEDDVFVIECATFSKNLAVTAGHDGRIKMWNINSGEVLLDYYNMIDGQVSVFVASGLRLSIRWE